MYTLHLIQSNPLSPSNPSHYLCPPLLGYSIKKEEQTAADLLALSVCWKSRQEGGEGLIHECLFVPPPAGMDGRKEHTHPGRCGIAVSAAITADIYGRCSLGGRRG